MKKDNTLVVLRHLKEQEIRNAAWAAFETPVTTPDGTVWNAGMQSALSIDGAIRLADVVGLTSVALYDLHNMEHVMSLQDGMAVAAAIGADYQRKFSAKQHALVALEQAESVETIQSITFGEFL